MNEFNINEIKEFKIGQCQNTGAATGCTVIISEKGAMCGVDVRGGSPGTRDTDTLNPINNRTSVHAILLSGGSSFGLDAAGGVMRYLEERKIGRDVGVTVVPNVCAAVLFDLKCGDSGVRPDETMGYAACEDAFSGSAWQSGNFGAGTGATVGTSCGIYQAMKGGIGVSALQHHELYAAAVVAVNCVGDIYDNTTGKIVAGARTVDGKDFIDSEIMTLETYKNKADFFSGNTIIGCIMTNAKLTKAQATKLAALGQNGIARAVRPAHTVYDGDTIFTMCTGEVETTLDAVGVLASHAVERAIVDAVRSASSFAIYPAARDIT